MSNSRTIDKFKQLIKFGIVGIANNVIFILIYNLLLKFNLHYLISNICAYVFSSFAGYVFNKIWVFEVKSDRIKKSLIKYYIVYGSSFLINISVMFILVDLLHISEYIAPYLILCITIPYNFILSKFWVYNK